MPYIQWLGKCSNSQQPWVPYAIDLLSYSKSDVTPLNNLSMFNGKEGSVRPQDTLYLLLLHLLSSEALPAKSKQCAVLWGTNRKACAEKRRKRALGRAEFYKGDRKQGEHYPPHSHFQGSAQKEYVTYSLNLGRFTKELLFSGGRWVELYTF